MSNQIAQDTFEKIAELGGAVSSQTKKAGKTIARQTVREATAGRVFAEKKSNAEKMGLNHTPLEGERMDYLKSIHESQEKDAKLKARLESFFKDYKKEEREHFEEEKRETAQENQQQAQEEEERKKREDSRLSAIEAPRGRKPRGMFTSKKVQTSRQEIKGGAGKY